MQVKSRLKIDLLFYAKNTGGGPGKYLYSLKGKLV
jgi:hypothetical protein